MDMGPISIKKHEWNFANMVHMSITKHKMFFGHFVQEFQNYFHGYKTIVFSQGLHKKRSSTMLESWKFRKSEN